MCFNGKSTQVNASSHLLSLGKDKLQEYTHFNPKVEKISFFVKIVSFYFASKTKTSFSISFTRYTFNMLLKVIFL